MTFEALYYNHCSIVFFMIDCESTDAVVLTCSGKPPYNSSAVTSDSTGLESTTVDQCKEKIRVDDPQNKSCLAPLYNYTSQKCAI